MRSIIASLIVFLIVTVALLHRTSAQVEPALPPTPPAAIATATQPAQQPIAPALTVARRLSQIPTTTAPAAPARASLAPTATPIPTTTATPDDPEPTAAEDPGDEPAEASATSATRTHLASATDDADSLHTGIWADAIRTLDGAVMGVVLSNEANVRAAPTTDAEIVTVLRAGWPIALYGVEVGDTAAGTDAWFRTWSGSYVSAAMVGPFIAPEPAETFSGHWVDVDLTTSYAIAYIDATPVYAAITITGKPGFETPIGAHSIFRRVEVDTLDSSTTGIPDGDPESYRLENVPWVQYFADGGFALHANYWSDPWEYGYARSHGCVNLMADDAAWFWQFLSIGSTVFIHE